MLEFTVIILIVGAAAFYVGRRLLKQLKGRGCEDCSCTHRAKRTEILLQIKPFNEKKL